MNATTTDQTPTTPCQKPRISATRRIARGIKRFFRPSRQTPRQRTAPCLSETVRMELALAIAQQYVRVSQVHPEESNQQQQEEEEENDTVESVQPSPSAACSPAWSDQGTLHSAMRLRTKEPNKRQQRPPSSVLGRIVSSRRRHRTTTTSSFYDPTVVDLLASHDDDRCCYEPSFIVASREKPICC
ncbi:hypothetical protein LPJ72_000004 [Coemansia sp. Benny D160-2]|nr:hypothetical protein LPJ72_000004 [Coemansia sp. Benny D160-2]